MSKLLSSLLGLTIASALLLTGCQEKPPPTREPSEIYTWEQTITDKLRKMGYDGAVKVNLDEPSATTQVDGCTVKIGWRWDAPGMTVIKVGRVEVSSLSKREAAELKAARVDDLIRQNPTQFGYAKR